MNQTSQRFATHRSQRSKLIPIPEPAPKPKLPGEPETPPKRDLSQRPDFHQVIQKIEAKEKKMQKSLKKQMDIQMAIIKDKAEKNEEKR